MRRREESTQQAISTTAKVGSEADIIGGVRCEEQGPPPLLGGGNLSKGTVSEVHRVAYRG